MTVIDLAEQDFQRDVIEQSHTTPVVVDFWAPWCGPCRALTPLLEKQTAGADGGVVLAKLNTDDNPGISQQFGIQGIPAVKAFVDGKVVDEFVGAQNPAFVERFFRKLVPSEADGLVASGDEVALRRALELEPGRPDAALELAGLLHRRGDSTEALTLLAAVHGNFRADGLKARIALEQPDGIDLSSAWVALDGGDPAGALDVLLGALPDPENVDAIRAAMVGIMDELGVDDPIARDARRRLAAALY